MAKDIEERFGPDSIEGVMRERIRATIELLVNEELDAALGASRSVRSAERRGYRHGTRERTLSTSLGPAQFAMPRARIRGQRSEEEWRSVVVGRYQRRTERVDAAILGLYLSGANTRRIRGALAPLLRGAPLSKDVVSRLVGRLAEEYRSWLRRDLAEERIRYLLLDGWYPRVRIGRRRATVPVLVVLGVRESGEKVVLDLRLAGAESQASWREVVSSLVGRHLGVPRLAVVDGNPGLQSALEAMWPGLAIQRCTNHKLRNLLSKAPAALREELKEDYRRMIYGEDAEKVASLRAAFVRKWRLRCSPVVTSLEEAGEELFTFLRFPPSQWRALRTTNALERINEEFRRRTKTQASLPSADAVVLLLFGLLRSGAIRLRRIDGWSDMPASDEKKIA
jgi:transposase-like protein